MKYISLLVALLIFGGCAQKVQIKSLHPAEISRAAVTKKIAVAEFKNDKVNLSGKIEAQIARYSIDGKPYFTTISRKDLDKVLAEQKIQDSGLTDNTAGTLGSLIGAQAIILGELTNPSMQRSDYYVMRTKCKKDQCREEKVFCTKALAILSAQVRMIDTQKGDIIYADSLSRNGEWSHCKDDSYIIPSLEMAAQQLSDGISSDFVYKLSPHYVFMQVTLLEKPDLEYSDRQKLLLESALESIKQNRFDKAENLLGELIDSTAEKSYVALYDLGVVKEAQGMYEDAQNLYIKADTITLKPIEEISKALLHIQNLIEQNKTARLQIEAK